MNAKKILHKTLCVLGALLLSVFCVFEFAIVGAKAEESKIEYTGVLEDLQKDENFNADDYPVVANDNSLQVIQIAESENKELFLYVYQPNVGSTALTATSVNMSTAIDGDVEQIVNYSLTLLNVNGVFCKYKVDDFSVKSDVLRFYYIVSIFRAYNVDLDGVPTTDNTTSEIAYSVAQQWTAANVNGEIVYSVEYKDVIAITDRYVGKIRSLDNFFFLF